MNSKISVIIPVYNVRPYLERCLESVLAQTHKDLEVIVVDDGSTDGSGEICDAFAEKDERVKVIHQLNQGQSVARNNALDMASGEWVAFLDSDDFIEPEMLEELFALGEKYDVDLCSCKTRCFYQGEELPKITDSTEERVFTYDEVIVDLVSNSKLRFEIWNKLWRRSLIGDVRFKVGQLGEEVYFDRTLFKKAGKLAHIDRSLHNYLISRPGNTNSSFKEKKLCIFDEFDEWIRDLFDSGDCGSAKAVAVIAAGFAMDIYIAARQTKQRREITKLLLTKAREYHRILNGTELLSRKQHFKLALFTRCPSLFILVRKMSLLLGK